MRTPVLRLTGLALLAATAFAIEPSSSSLPTPYQISIQDASGGTQIFMAAGVHGLPVGKLLVMPPSQPTPQRVPRDSRFSFMREWGTDLSLEGYLAPGSLGPTSAITVTLATAPPDPEALILGNPACTEWELFAENGVVAVETATFKYSTKQVVVLPPPPPVQR